MNYKKYKFLIRNLYTEEILGWFSWSELFKYLNGDDAKRSQMEYWDIQSLEWNRLNDSDFFEYIT